MVLWLNATPTIPHVPLLSLPIIVLRGNDQLVASGAPGTRLKDQARNPASNARGTLSSPADETRFSRGHQL